MSLPTTYVSLKAKPVETSTPVTKSASPDLKETFGRPINKDLSSNFYF